MDFQQSLALAGPPGYFILVLFLLAFVFKSLNSFKPKTLINNSTSMATVYLGLAAISCLHILYCLLSLFQRSYYDYLKTLDYTVVGSQTDKFAHWLMNTSVFKESWEYACVNVFTWWWLENLSIFTAGTWTLFLVTEGKRKEIPYLWVYMVLATFFSVSTASSLFYAALSYRAATPKPIPSKKNDDDVNAVLPASEEEAEVSAQIILPVFLALFIVSATPATDSPYFLNSILVVHALLFVPILPSSLQTRFPRFLNVPALTLYFGVAAISLALRIQSTLAVIGALDEVGIFEFAIALFQPFGSHPAVATFGWDTIWTSIAFITWYIAGDGTSQPKIKSLLPIISSTAALGVSLSAPVVLGNVIDEVFAVPETKEDDKIKEMVAE